MTLHLVDPEDAELDAMEHRDRDEPRTALGYEATVEPRGRRQPLGPTFWRVVEVPGIEPERAAVAKVCRKCNQPAPLLHQHPKQPNDPTRTICGKCQGDINRERM